MVRPAAAKFDIGRAGLTLQAKSRVGQRSVRLVVKSSGTPFNTERSSDERVSKQQAALEDEREHADKLPVTLRDKVMRLQPENVLEYSVPANAMEEGSLRAFDNELVPG
jgi:hypothetical protein